MLAARDLVLKLGGAPALAGVSAAIAPGQITAIIGPNGAGKSSLLACLAGLQRVAAGQVTLDDAPVLKLDPRQRARRIGFLPQVAEVNWDIDVETLVALGRLPHRSAPAADAAAITAAMAATDCAGLAGRVVSSLSGGERARVLLARVLAGQPDYLLADEPLANLDPGHQLDTIACLRAAADAGTGVAIVLHDLALAAQIADQLVLLHNGQVAANGTAAQVLTGPNVAKVYGIDIQVEHQPDGRLHLMVKGRSQRG
ncbi:ABC transporter [Sandarakinorhabdus cyanobacteriorum]|uniref:ABC transporter n=1 Tax=Sandarakinorhabdus cyanobacteriorum TaxID=1981098 RepID=A0A255YHM3_9SPHN|nr:ABC transporter ATP-binding protein [Sandarakinorhabdus cyanobacteriorum]OYQ28699.1 ABC transporter [Sandarakinorhabdus cyanobacteriorum]